MLLLSSPIEFSRPQNNFCAPSPPRAWRSVSALELLSYKIVWKRIFANGSNADSHGRCHRVLKDGGSARIRPGSGAPQPTICLFLVIRYTAKHLVLTFGSSANSPETFAINGAR